MYNNIHRLLAGRIAEQCVGDNEWHISNVIYQKSVKSLENHSEIQLKYTKINYLNGKASKWYGMHTAAHVCVSKMYPVYIIYVYK